MCGGGDGGDSSGLVIVVAAAVGGGGSRGDCYVWSVCVIVVVEVGMCLLTVTVEQRLQPQS